VIAFRQVTIGDAEQMLKWVSNKEIRDNLGLTNDPDLEKTQTWIARLSESKNILAMAIEVDNVYVGNVVLDQESSFCPIVYLHRGLFRPGKGRRFT